MTTSESARLRVWPNEPLPARPVWRYDFQPVEEEPDALVVHRHGPGRDIPDGLFLGELMTVDLESTDAILAFMEAYGPLGPDWQDRLPLGDAYGAANMSWEQYTGATIDSIRGLAESGFYARDPEYIPALLRSATLDAALSPPGADHNGRDNINFLTLDEFRIGARSMRDLARAWRTYTGTMTLEELQGSWESHHYMPDDIQEAVDWIVRELDDMSAFAPFVAREADLQLVTLTSALRLQVFNEMVKGSVALMCRNETCPYGVWYMPTKWNTGNRRYCCSECADMQTARERRRRVRDANRLARQGLRVDEIATRMGASVDRVEGWLAAAAKRRKGGK